MISVIIQCRDQEAELAKTLSALVSGAVEGIISDVTIIDDGSSDGTATVADAAGCHLYSSNDIAKLPTHIRSDWILLVEPGAKPLSGWIEALTEHINNGQTSARMSPSVNYRLPFLKRLLRKSSPLEYGVIMPKREFANNVKTAKDLAGVASGARTIKLRCEMVPASYTQLGA
jgi:cellulose synthase/poly-beta-1,6-N-acetylglucosamine synthase-like glycosyltransferase